MHMGRRVVLHRGVDRLLDRRSELLNSQPPSIVPQLAHHLAESPHLRPVPAV
jgi:hypothetical protein